MKPYKPLIAIFRFFGELNDFLPYNQKKKSIHYRFDGNHSIKDSIEAQGVPHTEVNFIVVNSKSVRFDYLLKSGDNVDVYPVSYNSLNVPFVKLREEPIRNPRFILDVHLGKLARLMRLLGFDSLYRNDYDDPEIVRLGVIENRVILTRDRRLLHAKIITYGYCLRSTNPIDQLSEVIRRFSLEKQIIPFSRCLVCNAALMSIEKQEIATSLEPKTRQFYDKFHRCVQCQKIYWKGSHFQHLIKIVERFNNN